MVITDLGVFAIDKKGGGMTLTELAPDVTLDEIKAKTQATYKVAPNLQLNRVHRPRITASSPGPKRVTEHGQTLHRSRCPV